MEQRTQGILLIVLSAVAFSSAGFFTRLIRHRTLFIRRQQHTPMLPATCLSALLCPVLVWPFTSPLAAGVADMFNLLLFGTTQFGLGLVF